MNNLIIEYISSKKIRFFNSPEFSKQPNGTELKSREREEGDLMGLHFVAFGSDNSERVKPLREGSDCAELLRKDPAEPRNATRGTESERNQLVERSELDRETARGPSRRT